jgi:hypothetical protein
VRCALHTHFLCGGVDRVDDVAVARATANYCRHGFANFVSGRCRIHVQKIYGHEQHSRGAEAALERVVFVKRLLQRMQPSILGKSFNRIDLSTIGLYGKHDARTHGLAIEKDCACAADSVFATHVRSGKRKIFPEKIREKLPWLAFSPTAHAVDGEFDIDAIRCQFFSPSPSLRLAVRHVW